MIFYSIPFSEEKNIGEYYNSFMKLLKKDSDYACFVDGDACFTTPFFGKQLNAIVNKYPECGLFTAMTNRVGCVWQLSGNWKSDDIALHRKHGDGLQKINYDKIQNVTEAAATMMLSGVLILIRKDVWKKIGGFNESGMLGVDTALHLKAKKMKLPVYLMKGVYLYHWYRGGDKHKTGHLL